MTFEEVKAALADAKSSLAGVSGDVAALKAKIDALIAAGSGAITQAQLDDLGADASALAASLKSLDEATPPPTA